MDINTADFRESSVPGSSNGSNNTTAGRAQTTGSRKGSAIVRTYDEEEEAEQPPQHVWTLRKLRFRPADDDEPQ